MSLLLFFQGSGTAPVTSTASWAQGAATWSATAVEKITATAAFAQTASWAATASERATGTASFAQGPAAWDATLVEKIVATSTFSQALGGQAVYTGTPPEVVTQDGEVVTHDDGGAWLALTLEEIPATASWDQSASWAAEASEGIPSTAAWAQDAAWAALGQSAEDVTAEATFEQAVASWMAASSELATGTATWSQGATWDAVAEQAFDASAAFSQAPAAWSAEAATESDSEAVTAAGTWVQAATWSATAASAGTPSETPVVGGFTSRRPQRIRLSDTIQVAGRASFGQGPADWGATLTVDSMPADIEELLLAGVL